MLEDLNKYKFLEPLKENWKHIHSEYKAIEKFNTPWGEEEIYNKGWEVFGLIHKNDDLVENQDLCPFTTNLIKQIPKVFIAGFSILKPNCVIYPHYGYNNKVLRSHLGLDCPKDAYLKVEDRVQCWENGEMFVFDDTKIHEACNNSDETRVIFILDFYK